MSGSPLTTGGIQESFIESCRGYLGSGAPTCATGSSLTIPFDTKAFDPYGNYNTTTHSFTASVRGGLYQLSASVRMFFQANINPNVSCALNCVLNGSTDSQFCVWTSQTSVAASGLSPYNLTLNGSTLLKLNGSDVITLSLANNLGQTLTISSGAVSCFFSIVRLGRIA